jgi:hypothetical protein
MGKLKTNHGCSACKAKGQEFLWLRAMYSAKEGDDDDDGSRIFAP